MKLCIIKLKIRLVTLSIKKINVFKMIWKYAVKIDNQVKILNLQFHEVLPRIWKQSGRLLLRVTWNGGKPRMDKLW